MKAYVEFEILEGAYDISCPDAMCPYQGIMDLEQDIAALVSRDLVDKHKRFRLNRGKFAVKSTVNTHTRLYITYSHTHTVCMYRRLLSISLCDAFSSEYSIKFGVPVSSSKMCV